jgi:5'(3')-deoxyribonucleotidase
VKPLFLLDCDGILSDFIRGLLDFVEKATGARPARESITTQHAFDHLDRSLKEPFEAHVRAGGFVSSLEPYPGAVDGFHRLSEIADVHIVTAPWKGAPTWMHERAEWLERHFGIPFDRVHHESSKFLTRGDYLLDDHGKHLTEWLHNHRDHFLGHALLWDTPHNRLETSFWRVRSWEQVITIVEEGTQSSR